MNIPGIPVIIIKRNYMTAQQTFFSFLKCGKTAALAAALFFNLHLFANNTIVHTVRDTIISGIVKDANGKPIANAKISSAVAGNVYTNSDGLFSFTLPTGKLIPQSFIFSYDTLMPEVRSYHPVMENAVYEIMLLPRKCCLAELLTKIKCSHEEEVSLPSLQFKPESSALTSGTRAVLKDIAVVLKDNPELTVTITAYPEQNDPKQRFTDKRLEVITDYLMEQAGVSGDRIVTEKKPGEGNGNSIDFKTKLTERKTGLEPAASSLGN